MHWLLHNRDLRHERVNKLVLANAYKPIILPTFIDIILSLSLADDQSYPAENIVKSSMVIIVI